MFYIDELTGRVMLNRGDDASFTLHINEGSNIAPIQYPLKKEDCIYFAIEEPNQPFENAIVKKVINTQNNLLNRNGDITFRINSEDTVCLMPGKYFYEIKMSLYKENIFTNDYIQVILDDGKYVIKEKNIILSSGTYINQEDVYYFTDSSSLLIYGALLQNHQLIFKNSGQSYFANLTYQQEQNKVNTIIPQTEWIVER